MSRRVPLALSCVLLLLAAAGTAYWFWATRALAAGFEQWAADRRAARWTIAAGSGIKGGWPFSASLTLPGVAVSGGDAVLPGGFGWKAARVTLNLSLFEPNRLEITPDGTQHIRIADGPGLAYAADNLVAHVVLKGGVAPDATDIRGNGVRLDLPGAARHVRIALLQAHLAWRAGAPVGKPAFSTALDATEITLPPGTRWPLGDRIAALSLDAALNGPVPALADPRRQAGQWRDGAGTVDVRRLSLGWGPLGLTARATLALDGQLQPAGTGVVRLVGYAEAADLLATTGALTRSAATAAKAVLGLLARLPEDGGAAEVEAPLTLQDRTLAMRQFPLMRLPVLTWPDQRP